MARALLQPLKTSSALSNWDDDVVAAAAVVIAYHSRYAYFSFFGR